jgi:hypothetical protein
MYVLSYLRTIKALIILFSSLKSKTSLESFAHCFAHLSSQAYLPSNPQTMTSHRTQMSFLDEPCKVLWVVIALTCLVDKLETTNGNMEEHRELCDALTSVSTTVLDMEIPVDDSRLVRLFRAGMNYYRGSDVEFLHLYLILEAFHHELQNSNAHASIARLTFLDMQHQMQTTIKQLLGPSMEEFLREANTMYETMTAQNIAEGIAALIHASASTMCNFIDLHVQEKTASVFLAVSDNCMHLLSQTMRRSMLEIINVCLRTVVSYREPGVGMVYNCSIEFTQNRVDHFYRNVSEFFPHKFPLLDRDYVDYLSEIEGNFERMDEVNDELALVGPASVDVEQVGITVANTSGKVCTICFEALPTMRKVKVCCHEYCEECLNGQLQSRHASRYKCATCRTPFL